MRTDLPKGWYLTFSPIITADWKAAGEDQWTVPLALGAGKIFKIGKLPFNGQFAAFYNVARPSIAALKWIKIIMMRRFS